jgi:hypothetical protein
VISREGWLLHASSHQSTTHQTDLDFFDVGQSIGDLILERTQLEDAFFIASILESSLESLRSRGFPVDRVLKPKPPSEPPKPEPAKIPSVQPKNDADQGSMSKGPATSQATSRNSSVTTNLTGGPPTVTNDPKASNDCSMDSGNQTNEVLPPDEMMKMVKDMFPDADEDFLRKQLGPSPSYDDVRRLAEQMAAGKYIKKLHPQAEAARGLDPGAEQSQTNGETDHAAAKRSAKEDASKKGKSGIKKSLGRAFGGFRKGGNQATPGGMSVSETTSTTSSIQSTPSTGTKHRTTDTGPVSPQFDAAAQANMESMLERAASSSAPVSSKGVQSTDTLLTSVPKELDRGSTCEIVPGQSLKPFSGPRGDGRTHNGIRIFAARNSPESEPFLATCEDAIEKFALVIRRLADVYDVPADAVAIFHDPRGGTIAFNSNRALHFNLRFFHALHYLQNKHESYDCYSYWMVVFAHELSHNLVSGHNKEHGFYTESYIAKYLPKFLALISTLPRSF